MTEAAQSENRIIQLWQNCHHPDILTDPETGEKVCIRCALTDVDEPLKDGVRFIPLAEDYTKYRTKLAQLDVARNYVSRAILRIGGIPCKAQGCGNTPTPGSKWCPEHGMEHKRQAANKRQQRHREKTKTEPVTPVTLPDH